MVTKWTIWSLFVDNLVTICGQFGHYLFFDFPQTWGFKALFHIPITILNNCFL
jgi:hypothetical protein